MGGRSRLEYTFGCQPSTPSEYLAVLELMGAVRMGELPPEVLESAEVQRVLRNFSRELVAVSRSFSSEAGGGVSRRRESSAGGRYGVRPADAGDSVNAPGGGGVSPVDIPPRVDHHAEGRSFDQAGYTPPANRVADAAEEGSASLGS